jgi:phage baseplate assembly protein W
MSLIARTYTDLDLDFLPHPVTKDILKKKDISAIIGSVKNLLYTNHYERLFKPQIGSNIRRLLFEPLDAITATSLSDEILYTINSFETRMKVEGVEVVPDYENSRYDVGITFFMINDPNPISIKFFLERVR